MLDGIRDTPEAFQIHVLVVPEHLCAGVSDKGWYSIILSDKFLGRF